MLRIDIVKQSDGSGVLRCTRADGSVSWQKQSGRHAAFFALHDLTHYAVETVLGYRRGFFGMVAEGWEMEDTTGKGSRGPLPPEAAEVEHLVGLFDAQRGSGTVWTADEFNAFSHRSLTEQQLHAILARRAELFRQWGGVAAGQALTLMFD